MLKKYFMLAYLILFFLILATCAKELETKTETEIPVSEIEQLDLVKAKQLLETACVSCHSATASEDSRLAPPLEAVKRRYLRSYPNIEDFTPEMAAFITQPTEEKALMYGAVNRFDIMPPIPFPEEDLIAIATYMYQFELELPDWFEEHYQEMHGNKGKGQGNGMKMRKGNGN